jgi:hypothetical protein
MICENCHGARYINGLPCQSCAGSGLQHCCEGPVGNAADLPPELPEPEDFDECEWCEDFDECLSVGHCIDG